MSGLLQNLLPRFRERVRRYDADGDKLTAYVDGALRLDEQADIVAARCWVGLFAEAVRDATLFAQMRRLMDAEIATIQERSGGRFSSHDAQKVGRVPESGWLSAGLGRAALERPATWPCSVGVPPLVVLGSFAACARQWRAVGPHLHRLRARLLAVHD